MEADLDAREGHSEAPVDVGGHSEAAVVAGGRKLPGGHTARLMEAELDGDSAETILEGEGGHSEATVVVDGAETKLVEAKLGADGAETILEDGGGHSTRVVVAILGVVEGELLLETRTRPVLSRETCFSSRLSKLRRRS